MLGAAFGCAVGADLELLEGFKLLLKEKQVLQLGVQMTVDNAPMEWSGISSLRWFSQLAGALGAMDLL